ncbi:hypothetical protein ACFY7C_20970 [Streptomyces sp. NPDC012769]|uniref:hypothetical protein n=1 Tax=Streptomyces sp. NPDC012769 TaxID=3364848 RepID=UPI0036C24E87
MTSLMGTSNTPRRHSMAAAFVMAAALAAPTPASAHVPLTAAPANARSAALTCRVSTSADRPITFTPPLTLRQRSTRITATLRLTGCTDAHGKRVARLHSGTLTTQGTAQAGCTSARDIKGSATITWYDAAGRKTDTSTIQGARRAVSSYNPGDALLGGKVTAGALQGTTLSGTATPTSDVSSCTGRGLHSLRAAGKLKFLR